MYFLSLYLGSPVQPEDYWVSSQPMSIRLPNVSNLANEYHGSNGEVAILGNEFQTGQDRSCILC